MSMEAQAQPSFHKEAGGKRRSKNVEKQNTAKAALEAQAREIEGELATNMARKRCGNCSIVGNWKVQHTDGRRRKVKCKSCGAPGIVVAGTLRNDVAL